MKPSDPEFEPRTRDNFSRQAFMRHLGVQMTGLRPGYCQLELQGRTELNQQHGLIHGGVVATLADVAGGYAAFSLLPARATNVTVEFKINFVAPANGGGVIARAEVLRKGRSLTVCRSDVFSIMDRDETLCATVLATYMTIKGKD
jgi:uncharacterized protein (TIGR00369 family)